MSEDQTTQAAVDETKVAAVPATEATSAQDGDDLSKILAEFDEKIPAASDTAKPETRAEAADETKVATQTILDEAAFIRNARFKQDMDATIKDVRGDLPESFFDAPFVQAWIDAQAMKNPALGQAWAKRHEHPEKFKQVVGALGRDFAKKYGKLPDPQATEDREAVAAAVRGSSTRAPEGKAPDYAKMTPGEFQREKEKAFGG